MKNAKDILTVIRIGFADAKHIISKIPSIVKGLKKSSESRVMRAHFHNMVDSAIDLYGDIALDIAKNADLNAFQNLAEDVALLVGKHKEPITKTLKVIAEALQGSTEKYQKACQKPAAEIAKLLKVVAKKNGWDKGEYSTLPSDLIKDAEYAEEQKRNEQKKAEYEAEQAQNIKSTARNLKYLVTEEQYKLRFASELRTYDQFIQEQAEVIVKGW